jgi:hypothetical protein
MGNLNVEAITSGFVPLEEVMKYHIWSMEYNENIRRNFCKENGYKELVQAVVIEGDHLVYPYHTTKLFRFEWSWNGSLIYDLCYSTILCN